jgi:hypothetical protein
MVVWRGVATTRGMTKAAVRVGSLVLLSSSSHCASLVSRLEIEDRLCSE